MNHYKRKILLFTVAVIVLSLIVPACVSITPPSTEAVKIVYPTVVITQYITQIVATPTITPTPPPYVPDLTPSAVVNIGWDPYMVEIYYPIVNCVASRLHEGDVAFVAQSGVGLSVSKDLAYSPLVRKLAAGEMLDITKGPWCSSGSLIWKVQTSEGEDGFVPEGDGELYWLLPMPPGTKNAYVKLNPWDIINAWIKTRSKYKSTED